MVRNKLKMHIIDDGIPIVKRIGDIDDLEKSFNEIKKKYRGKI